MAKKHKKNHKGDKLDKSGFEEKPLKLVLKVGGGESTTSVAGGSDFVPDIHDTKKHKHKKKKKKHKHEKQDREKSVKREAPPVITYSEDSQMVDENEEPPAKKALFTEKAPAPRFQETQPEKIGSRALTECLIYMHRILQKKDANGIFAFPVTDSIAPGYSSIIHNPMDFSTIKTKVDGAQYASVQEFKRDFKLMCNNCCVYNRPETIYYQEAKRLLGSGIKLMSKEKLINMRKSMPFMKDITNEELGIEVDEIPDADVRMTDSPSSVRSSTKSKPKKQKPSPFEAFQDDLTADEIIAQAQEAAKDAADELTLRKPNSKIGFLRRKKDGTTTLNIINPDNSGIVGEKERVVNLGALVGKLATGTGNLPGFREDKRNKATPVMYMNYGPFSSHAPVYDSSFSSICKEDSDRLLSTYGDEQSTQYAKSLRSFVEDAGDIAVKMVDSLLDVLTHGDHSKYMQELKQKEEAETAQRQLDRLASGVKYDSEQDISHIQESNSARSISDIGIDVSFLDALEEKSPNTSGNPEINNQLQQASELLGSLQEAQYQRLSARPPVHLAHVAQPSQKEVELASKVTKQLTSLAKQVHPQDVVSVQGLRGAMGMTLDPVTSTSQSDDDDQSGNVANPFAPGNNVDMSEFFPGDQNATTPIDPSMLTVPSVVDALDSPMNAQVDSTTN